MKPILFEGYEVVLGAPHGWDEAARGPCMGLPIYRANGGCISIWKLTWKERLSVLFGAKISLGVYFDDGRTQPPVSLCVTRHAEITIGNPIGTGMGFL